MLKKIFIRLRKNEAGNGNYSCFFWRWCDIVSVILFSIKIQMSFIKRSSISLSLFSFFWIYFFYPTFIFIYFLSVVFILFERYAFILIDFLRLFVGFYHFIVTNVILEPFTVGWSPLILHNRPDNNVNPFITHLFR